MIQEPVCSIPTRDPEGRDDHTGDSPIVGSEFALGSETSGPAVLSMTLAPAPGNCSPSTPGLSVLTVSGPLTPDTLVALARFAECGMRPDSDLVMDLHAVSDFPTRLFACLHDLSCSAARRRCRLRLEGLDVAIAGVVRGAFDGAQV
jgi:ABC-type transporter Mla MlaB component